MYGRCVVRESRECGCRVPLALPATAVALTEKKNSQFEACGVTVGDRPLCVPIFTSPSTHGTRARCVSLTHLDLHTPLTGHRISTQRTTKRRKKGTAY